MPSLNKSDTPSIIPMSIAIPALLTMIIGGGAIFWKMRSNSDQSQASADKRPTRVSRAEEDFRVSEPITGPAKKFLPKSGQTNNVHSIYHVVENGRKVVLIRLVPGGDELVIDEDTGKLLETRPSGNRAETKNGGVPGKLPGMRPAIGPMGNDLGKVNAKLPTAYMP